MQNVQAKGQAARVQAIKSRLSSIKAQLDARQRRDDGGSRTDPLRNATSSLPNPAGRKEGPKGGKRVLPKPVGRGQVDRQRSNSVAPARNVGPAPLVKKTGLVSAKTIPFKMGRLISTTRLSHETEAGKNVGIIHAMEHSGRLPQKQFEYRSKQFLDEMGEIVSGSEYLYQAAGTASSGNAVIGTCIRDQQLNPQFFRSTRLFQRSQLWNRFRFKRLVFEYEPAVASTVGGDLIMCVSLDPTENPCWDAPQGDSALRRLKGYNNTVTLNSYAHASVHIEFTDENQWFYIGNSEDIRFESQGQYLLVEALPPATLSANRTSYGLVQVHYEIEFCGAVTDLNPETFEQQNCNLYNNTNATPWVVGQPVKLFFSAQSSTQNALYISPTSFTGSGVYQIKCVNTVGSTTVKESGSSAGATERQLTPGLVFYAKPTSNLGEYRIFRTMPDMLGDASMDDQQLVIATTGTNISGTVDVQLICATNDPQF